MEETMQTINVGRSQASEERPHQQALVRKAQEAVEILAASVPVLGSGSPATARAIRRFIGAVLPPLSAGVPLVELLAALATEPTEPTAAPTTEPSWTPYLGLSVEEFLTADVSLEIWNRAGQFGAWLGPAAVPSWVWKAQIWDAEKIYRAFDEASVPESERTIGKLIRVLGVEIQEMRRATA
jgi:hypothetical protein